MSKLHRVLAAVDFSAPARVAFDHALALSRLHGAALSVVHAIPSETPVSWDARDRSQLMIALGEAAKAAGVPFTFTVQSGDPAKVILLHANARQPDLIVLGTGTRSAFDRFRFGSVAETVARKAAQPVLVVPEATDTVAGSTPFTNVVVAVDFHEGSSTAVERALAMAGGDSRVTVVHVVRGVPYERAYRYPHKLMEPEYQRSLARSAWRRMRAIVPFGATTGRKVHARVVTGEPTAQIARVAAEVGADLILVGVTSRGPIGRWFMGSTAARVIRTAGRPVLAIPQPVSTAVAPAGDTRLPLAA